MESLERSNNPWEVENVEDFLYFCCPECDEKNHSRDHFLKHAFDQHPKSKEYLEKWAYSIKDELKEEINQNRFIKDEEMEQSMKEEKIDEGTDDPNMYLNSNYLE